MSTCYVAGGMPLAFTQEDFLVNFVLTAVQVKKFFSCTLDIKFFLTDKIRKLFTNQSELDILPTGVI